MEHLASSARAPLAVVLNGNAGSITAAVIERVRAIVGPSDVYVSHDLAEVPGISDAILSGGYPSVLTGGGDGTFSVMVTELSRAASARQLPLPRFALLRLGTGNALASVLGSCSIDRNNTLASWLEVLRRAKATDVRLVSVDGKLSPFAGLGADAQVLADYNATKRWMQQTPLKPIAAGLFGYSLAALTRSLPKYLFLPMAKIRVTNIGGPAYRVGPGGSIHEQPLAQGAVLYEGRARIAGVATIPCYGFDLRMFPHANLHPDRMQLRISTLGSLRFAKNLGAIWRGTYESPDSLFDFLVEGVHIECEPATDVQVGGDAYGRQRELTATLSPISVPVYDVRGLT